MGIAYRLGEAEKRSLDSDGYVLRADVFDAREVAELVAASESLVQQLLDEKRRRRFAAGSYSFEPRRDLGTIIKWEPDAPDLVQGVELFAHLNDVLGGWGMTSRLIDPARDLIGCDDVILFTEKLNVKRARHGGPIILHQDFPYWKDVAPNAAKIATAMIFLDDATRENGCLEVVPGSHLEGEQQRRSLDGLGGFEIDPERYDYSRLVALEVRAGSVVYFGPFLVHRSLPNRSEGDRRALLYSYQAAGGAHLRDSIGLGNERPANDLPR